jgi:hypothetical protein
VGASPSLCAPVDARDWVGGGLSRRRDESRRPAVDVNGGGGAPVLVSGEEGVGKLQDGVGKLEVGSIGVEEGREGVLHGEQGAAAGGGHRQWCSGRNSMAFRGW